MKLYKGYGNIYFYPPKYSDKSWVILNSTIGIVQYYQYWIEKYYGIKVQKPKHGSHISVVREEEVSIDLYEKLTNKYQNKIFEYTYSNKMESNGNHIWLPVYSGILLDIREDLNLKRNPKYSLHLTIGRLKEKDLDWFDLNLFQNINKFYDNN